MPTNIDSSATNATTFCVKSPDKEEPLQALKSMLSLDANILILAYGYIAPDSKQIKNLMKEFVKWLKWDDSRVLEVYVGVFPDYRECKDQDQCDIVFNEEIDKTINNFQKLLPDSLYDEGVTSRVHAHALVDFHCKFALLGNHLRREDIKPVAALFGSTNLSWSALKSESRFELDLYIDGCDPLLHKFTDAALDIINSALKDGGAEIKIVRHAVRERIFENPALQELTTELEKAKEEEVYARVNYSRECNDQDMRDAYIESDSALEISSYKLSR